MYIHIFDILCTYYDTWMCESTEACHRLSKVRTPTYYTNNTFPQDDPLRIYIYNQRGDIHISIYMYIWSTQEKTQLFASSNGNCNRSTHLKFRSRTARGVPRPTGPHPKRRHAHSIEVHRKLQVLTITIHSAFTHTVRQKTFRKRKGNTNTN